MPFLPFLPDNAAEPHSCVLDPAVTTPLPAVLSHRFPPGHQTESCCH